MHNRLFQALSFHHVIAGLQADLSPLGHDGVPLRHPVAGHGGHDGDRPVAREDNEDIAEHQARPADVARLQPLLEPEVDEPGVEPGEVEDEEGGDVSMKNRGAGPEREMI